MGYFKMRRSNARLAVLVLFYVVYLIIGASIFSAVEGPEERESVKMLRSYRQNFLKDNRACLTDEELEAFIVKIVRANNRGVSAIRNVTNEPNWSFGQAFFFAGTVLTTIGYGHVTPLSEGGKVFCIVYAVIGIPLTLIFLSAIVERLMIPATLLLDYMQNKLGQRYERLYVKLLHLSAIILALLVTVFLVPAAIFDHLELDWNYIDAFYYCFISMTTIGLGDYIPGDSPDQRNRVAYKIITTVYLFLGLIIMMVMLATVHRIPELNLGTQFYMSSNDHEAEDEEKVRLRGSEKSSCYSRHEDETETTEVFRSNTSDCKAKIGE